MINNNRYGDKIYVELLDIISIIISFFCAIWIRNGVVFDVQYKIAYGLLFFLLILGYICIFYFFNFYSEFFERGFLDEFACVFRQNILLALLITGILFSLKIGAVYSRIFFASFFFFNVLINYVVRQYIKVILLAYYKRSGSSSKVMLITTSDLANNIIGRMKKEWEFQVTSIAIIDKDMSGEFIGGIQVKANRNSLFDIATKEIVDEVFIKVPNDITLNMDEVVLRFENIGIKVNLCISAFNISISEKTVKNFAGYDVLIFTTKVVNKGSLALKRGIDILGSVVGLAITFVVGIFVAPAILIESQGPIFFSQIRIGKNGRRFKLYKFRSMYKDAEERKNELLEQNEIDGPMFKITKDPRVTKVGEFIRKTSIDELPQFFNVLKGDMSLVGTRPPTEDEFLLYEGRHKRRLSLQPGITGLWQVSGRSDIDNFEDVVNLDLKYIDNWSIFQDFKLLAKTVIVVLLRVGAK